MRRYWPGIIICLVFFLTGLLTLKDYGINEDSPFHFLRGQAYLQEILTGSSKSSFSNRPSPVFFIPGQRISLYKPNTGEELVAPIKPFGFPESVPSIQNIFLNSLQKNKKESFYKNNAWGINVWDIEGGGGHPAVSDILMAASNRVFYETLGILADLESYHIYVVLVSTLGIFFLYLFTQEAFGLTAAILASIGLALFPVFFGESHFNIKDPVQMSFFIASVVSFYFWISKGHKMIWFAIFVIATFLAVGTKENIAFLPFIVLPWLFLIRKKIEIKTFLNKKNLLIYGSLAIIVPILLLILTWPYLWTDTFRRILDMVNFYSFSGAKDLRVEKPSAFNLILGLDATSMIRVFTMTPPILLLLFLLGLVGIFSRKIKGKFKEEWLVFLWLMVPLFRVIWQSSSTFGLLRNFIEYLPPFMIIAGVGGEYFSSKFKVKSAKWVIATPLPLVTFALLLLPIIRLHPNENLYFNFLTGGLKGAFGNGIYDWEASYDNPYRQAVNWLNQNTPQNARLAHLDGSMLAISPLWLREDIRQGTYFSGFHQNGEYIISILYPDPPAVFAYNYLDKFLDPIYELKVDGVTILKIWQNDPKQLKKEISENRFEGKFNINTVENNQTKLWELSLDSKQKITRILFKNSQKCLPQNEVWSYINEEGKEVFFNPQNTIQNQIFEVDFPAIETEKIRFRDLTGNSCLINSEVEEIDVLR